LRGTKKNKTGAQNQTDEKEGKTKEKQKGLIWRRRMNLQKNAGSDLCYDTLFAKTNFPLPPRSSLKIWKREKKTKNPTAGKKAGSLHSRPQREGRGGENIQKNNTPPCNDT